MSSVVTGLGLVTSFSDSDFVWNVSVGNFITNHAVIRCQLDFSCPSTNIEQRVSYSWYPKVDIDHFHN